MTKIDETLKALEKSETACVVGFPTNALPNLIAEIRLLREFIPNVPCDEGICKFCLQNMAIAGHLTTCINRPNRELGQP